MFGSVYQGLVTIFLIIFCDRSNLPVGATFYIEILHRNGNYLSEKLFECPLIAEPILRGPQTFWCFGVGGDRRKKKIYATANFYLVTFPKLKGDNRFVLLDSLTPRSFFVGVPLLSKRLDWPNLLEDGRDFIVSLLRRKFADEIRPCLLGDIPVDTVAVFMSIANFRFFARPIPNMVARYEAFAQVLRNVVQLYRSSGHGNRRKRIKFQARSADIRDVQSAVQLFVKKLIDPCFILTYRGEIDPRAAATANALCRAYCQFLAVGFSVFPISKRRDCSHFRGDGRCTSKVCKCSVSGSLFGCGLWPRPVAMIRCSNALRLGIRRYVTVKL